MPELRHGHHGRAAILDQRLPRLPPITPTQKRAGEPAFVVGPRARCEEPAAPLTFGVTAGGLSAERISSLASPSAIVTSPPSPSRYGGDQDRLTESSSSRARGKREHISCKRTTAFSSRDKTIIITGSDLQIHIWVISALMGGQTDATRRGPGQEGRRPMQSWAPTCSSCTRNAPPEVGWVQRPSTAAHLPCDCDLACHRYLHSLMRASSSNCLGWATILDSRVSPRSSGERSTRRSREQARPGEGEEGRKQQPVLMERMDEDGGESKYVKLIR